MLVISLLVALSLNQAPPAADQPGRISGRITIAGANTPVSGARVILVPAGPPAGPPRGPMGPPPQTTTDQDGRYQFDRVAPGTYRVEAQKTGLAAVMGVPPDLPLSAPVQVAPGQSVDGVDRQLQKGAVIAGRILDSNGEPLPDLQIMVLRSVTFRGRSGGPPRMVPAPGQGQQTNDLGEFRVSGLAPGEYYVAAMPRPAMFGAAAGGTARAVQTARTTLARTFYPGTLDQAAAQPLAVAAGAEVGNIVFTMQSAPAFRVSGVVVDEDGNPVAGAMVMLMGDPMTGGFMGPAGSARSQDNGRFEIPDVPPGSYRANASVMTFSSGASGIGSVSSSFTNFGGSNRPEPIVVTDADVKGVRVVTRRQAPR